MFEEYRDEIYRFFDGYAVAFHRYFVVSTIHIQLGNQMDDAEKIIHNIDNPDYFSSIEFILPPIEGLKKKEQEYLNSGLSEKEISLSFKELVLQYFKDTTGEQFENEFDLFKKSALNGLPFIISTTIDQSIDNVYRRQISGLIQLAKKTIFGNLRITKFEENSGIRSFGNIEKIIGSLGVYSEIDNMGNLKEVTGDVSFTEKVVQNKLLTLIPLEKIGGSLFLRGTRASLGSLIEIGGNLNLRKTLVRDLGRLTHVNGNILISRYNEKFYTPRLKDMNVNGKIKRYHDGYNIKFNDDEWLENILNNSNYKE